MGYKNLVYAVILPVLIGCASGSSDRRMVVPGDDIPGNFRYECRDVETGDIFYTNSNLLDFYLDCELINNPSGLSRSLSKGASPSPTSGPSPGKGNGGGNGNGDPDNGVPGNGNDDNGKSSRSGLGDGTNPGKGHGGPHSIGKDNNPGHQGIDNPSQSGGHGKGHGRK